MAIGSEDTVVLGKYGRIAPAPHGSIYVRDEAAAVAAALKEKVELFESQGLELPEYLQQQVAEAGEPGEPIILVIADEVTQDSWRLLCDAEASAPEPELPFDEPAVEPVVEPVVDEPAVEEVVEPAVEEVADEELVEESFDGAPKPRRGRKS